MVYFISYDLNKSGKDYSGVHEAIKAASDGSWTRIMESAWIIRSNHATADAVFAQILPHLDSDDVCIVIEVRNNTQGHLRGSLWDYINGTIFA